mgnify:CR=1 FL=1
MLPLSFGYFSGSGGGRPSNESATGPADKVLAVYASAAFLVMVGACTLEGPMAMWCLILVGLCHSIMFPAIFAMGIKGLGPLTEEASGLLIMAIAGGALVVLQGKLADAFGLQWSFLLTVACELYVLWYAVWGCKVTVEEKPQQLTV